MHTFSNNGFKHYKNTYHYLVKATSDVRPFEILTAHRSFLNRCLSYYGGKIGQGPPDKVDIGPTEEARLWKVRRRSPKARKQLVLKYLCHSFKIAVKMRGPRLDFDEAVSAANAGLMEAMDGFDGEKGGNFMVYSTMIIRRHVINALLSTYPVKIPEHLRKQFGALTTKQVKKLVKDGGPSTLKELFELLGKSSDFDVSTLTVQQEDAPFMPGEAESPSETCETSGMTQEVRVAMLAVLDETERAVMEGRHYKDPPESFEAMGRRLKKTKDRLRIAYDRSLVKLREYLEK